MNKKPIQTFHLLAVAKSLQKQNKKVGMLLAILETFMSLNGLEDRPGGKEVIKAANECREAMWPEEY